MKIMLLNPPQARGFSQPPMSLLSLQAYLEQAGYSVSLYDANAEGCNVAGAVIGANKGDLVGITVVTPMVETVKQICDQLQAINPKIFIVLGGAHPTVLPDDTLRYIRSADAVIRGEGEKALAALAEVIADKTDIGSVPNLTYRLEGSIVKNPQDEEIVSVEDLPYLPIGKLDLSKYKPIPPHGKYPPYAPMITSRGCPYSCAYCSKGGLGNKYRAQSSRRVVNEMQYLNRRLGIKEIAFFDDVFTLNRNRIHDICADLESRRSLFKVHWSCITRVDLVDLKLLKHMKKAGCYAIAFGIESGSQMMLDKMNKKVTIEQIEDAVDAAKTAGMDVLGYFMFGYPGETVETIELTMNFARKLPLDYVQFSPVVPFPGTDLHELYKIQRPLESHQWHNFADSFFDSVKQPVFENDDLTRFALTHWQKLAYRQWYFNPGYLWRRLLRLRSFNEIKIAIKGLIMLLGNFRR